MQIVDVTRTLTAGTGIKLGAFIGGANINRQLDKLKKEKPQIAIGTPGRILKHDGIVFEEGEEDRRIVVTP